MNFTPDTGWYYTSPDNRAPAWTGVEFFYDFLVNNTGVGPYAREVAMEELLPGDVIQLQFSPERFGHTTIVVSVGAIPTADNILIAAHTLDNDCRPISTYTRAIARRYLQIESR